MVLVDLMLHRWRRISIVSILFSIWPPNVSWTKEAFFCSPRLFMDVLTQSTLAQGHAVVYYLTEAPRSLTCVSWVSSVSQPVNSEASVMEALVACSNIMSYRTNVRYLVFYIASFQKWQSTNNIPNHYRQQSSANANLHYHSGVCVINLEPLSRGQHPITLYYEPHAFLQTQRVRTRVAGMVFWDHMTYDPHQLPPIKALSIADMLGAG